MKTEGTAPGQQDHEGFYLKMRERIAGYLATEEGKTHPWAEALLLAPDLFHLLTRLVRDPRVPLKEKAKLGAALAYFLSPVELLPELILGPVGFLDDIALATYALNSVLETIDPAIVREHWAGQGDVLEVVRGVVGKAHLMLGGRLWGKLTRRFRR
jgi:uncharacterized membrane protein YkvA (DUF1232 family)